jgi:hypothetical protein
MAYGNQKQMAPTKRRHALTGREPMTEGGASRRLRPTDEWIAVASPGPFRHQADCDRPSAKPPLPTPFIPAPSRTSSL